MTASSGDRDRYFLIDTDGSGRQKSHVYDREDGGYGKKDNRYSSLCGQRRTTDRDAKALRHERFDCERCNQILRDRGGL